MVVVSTAFSAPMEGILFQTPSTKLLINDQDLGTGTLYITEHNVVWGGGATPSGVPAPTISLLYPSISLHAVQRDPSPALYMVLNYELRVPGMSQQSGAGDANEDDEFDAEDQPITQLRFVPQNEHDLQPMYSAMSQGQALHPDPADEVDDEDDDPYMDGEDFEEAGDEEFEDAEESSTAQEDAAQRLHALRIDQANGTQYDGNGENEEIGEQ